MRKQTIEKLLCPQCGSSLNLIKSFVENKQETIYGVSSCTCSSYPILNGVLVLRKEKETELALKELYAKRFSSALAHAIRWERFPNPSDIIRDRLGFLLGTINFLNSAPRSSNILNENLTFRRMIKKLGLGRYGNYLINRFSLHTFWNTYALLPLIHQSGESLLDFGCGAGHSSFVLSHFINPQNYYSVDVNLLNLILTKRYFADTQPICISGQSSLPFKDQFFSTIFSMDCFHYVSKKAEVAKELKRVSDSSGSIIMPHLHNSMVYNIAAGRPLSASAYARLFEGRITRVFPEDTLLRSFIFDDRLNLEKIFSNKELDAARSVTLISASNTFFKTYTGIKRYLEAMKDHLIINPLYGKPTKINEECVFKFKLPRHRGLSDYSFLEEYYLTDKIVPKQIAIKKDVLQSIDAKSHYSYESAVNKLIESFVLVNAPNNY